MAEYEGLRTSGANLVLGAKGIEIDEKGRIRFVDPEILQALVRARPVDQMAEAGDSNGSQCNCTNVPCLKELERGGARVLES